MKVVKYRDRSKIRFPGAFPGRRNGELLFHEYEVLIQQNEKNSGDGWLHSNVNVLLTLVHCTLKNTPDTNSMLCVFSQSYNFFILNKYLTLQSIYSEDISLIEKHHIQHGNRVAVAQKVV